MSDEEENFTESEEGSDFSASEEDEWVPSKDTKKKQGAKKFKAESSSGTEEDDEDDEDSPSEDGSDLEEFEESSKKKKGKQSTARKRPASKTSPKPATGGKRKRLSPGLRDRLYQQYKKDLLKEIAPARPPLNSSVSDILQKCQYQRKGGAVGSQSRAEDSDSSGDDHLVDPEKLDLGSTFFNKHDKTQSTSGSGPHFDVNAGMRLSDSSDGEDPEARSGRTGEEFLPASIPKQAADKLISHINQQSGEFMNFHNLDQFTAKVEEAKRFLKNYQQKEAEHVNSESLGDGAALTAKHHKESVSNLLALGETDAGISPRKVQSNTSSDSEWEEVQTVEGAERKPESESKPKDVTIEMDTAQSRRKRREELEMELYIKRQINKVKRANQLNYHKSSVLVAIAVGRELNHIIGGSSVKGFLISIMQEKVSVASIKWDEKKVQSLANWFRAEFTLLSNDYLGKRNGCSLAFNLSLALYTRKVNCRRDYILLFLACLRLAGAQARIVLSASVPSKRPAMNDLCPMSERQIKENTEKRLSNGTQSDRPLGCVQKQKKDCVEIPKPNGEIPENLNVEQSVCKTTPTKENTSKEPLKSTTQKVATRRTTRRALATLNIPQLDGADDVHLEATLNVIPLRRSLRSSSASAIPVASPGSSPFTKRKSNTPGSSNSVGVGKTKGIETRKRKLFTLQKVPTYLAVTTTTITTASRPAARSSARKQAKEQKETKRTLDSADQAKEVKVKRQIARPSTPSDDDAFVSKGSKSKKMRAARDKGKPSGEEDAAPLINNGKVPTVVLTPANKSIEQKVVPANRDVVGEPDEKKIVKGTLKVKAEVKPSNVANKSINRKELSPDSSSEDESAKQNRKVTTKKNQEPLAGKVKTKRAGKKKQFNPSSDDLEADSDFELPKASSKHTKKSPTASKGKKSSAVKRGGTAGARQVGGDKTDLWIEFYCEKSKRWITFDLASGRADCVDYIVRNATSPISYVFAWDNEGIIKDITARYVQNWNTACRILRVEHAWLDKVLAPFVDAKTNRDLLEDKELNKLDADKPLPKTIGELKNHPLYALRRHLLKFEALYPAEPPSLGFIRGEAIYPRECVFTLQTREKWYKQGRVVRPFETAYKVVRCWKYDRPTNKWLKDQPCEIFGLWQTDEYDPPTAENGLVPRNEYGNVELFTEKMLPKGTVHLKLPGLNKVCKRLQIDCAPALTGFDMAKMRMVPVYDGFVVCQEFAEKVVEEWYKEMEQEERRELEKKEKRVYGNWKRLIKGLLVRRKLQNKYNFDNLA